MIYLFWFVEFVYNILIVEPLRVGAAIFDCIVNTVESFSELLSVLPPWLSSVFYTLFAIAVLFRVSQFIPTLGGASTN